MVKHRIVESNVTIEDEPLIEVRLINANGTPLLQARNPGGSFSIIAQLTPDGGLLLSTSTSEITGLRTNDYGQIRVF